MNNIAEKDIKYVKYYQSNDTYWGLGIENEIYFLLPKSTRLTGDYIKQNRKRERYSVDYKDSYDQDKLTLYLNKIFLDDDIYRIPQYVNSHTLTKTDLAGEHRALYIVGSKINPSFSGKSMDELLHEFDEMFKTDFGDKYVYDGDTIEFITQNFYKTTVELCIQELVEYKTNFLTKLNLFFEKYGLPKVKFPKINYGLVQFKTNPFNVALFNNGTYHINITMPTKLNADGQIADIKLFEKQHRNAINLFQWIEPFLIAIYGCPDIFSFDSNDKYSAGSLRLTASRYIGVGTYDIDRMLPGKQLNDLKKNMFLYQYDKSWYNQLYRATDYGQGDYIGYDINYIKHYNAGIEFRIFDFFPEDALTGLINLLVLLLDHSLVNEITRPVYECDEWHTFTKDAILHGYTTKVTESMAKTLSSVLNLPLIHETNILKYMVLLIDYLYDKYGTGVCSSAFSPNMNKPRLHNVNRYMWENNYLQYIPINNKNHTRVTKLFEVYESFSICNDNNKLHNLLISTDLLAIKNMSLKKFYKKLSKIAKKKIRIGKYQF